MKKILHSFKALLLGLVFGHSTLATDLNHQLDLIFQALAKIENPDVQVNLMRGALAELTGKKDIQAPKSWNFLRKKLARSEEPEVLKLTVQLSQILGDLSVSEDALKLVMNEDANLDERKDALASLVSTRYEKLPPRLKFLLDSALRIDAIRAYSSFNYPQTPEELISEYNNFDILAKRATMDVLVTNRSFAKALLGALRTEKISKADIPNYVAKKMRKKLGNSFDDVYGKIFQMGELSKINEKAVGPAPDGFAEVRRIEVGVLPGLKFDIDRIRARAGEKVVFVFLNDDPSGMMHNLAIITPGSSQKVLDAVVGMGVEGLKKNYVPEIPELLASTPQVAIGMKYTLYFAVPEEPGDYHFICTYPGHGLLMHGVFSVQ